jgi:hypothetical protein
MSEIVILSGHYPQTTEYAMLTKKIIMKYCNLNQYDFFYDNSEPEETSISSLHFRRSSIIQNAHIKFQTAKWFIWLDSDVYVNKFDMKIESCIDLSDDTILYHLFHESPWGCYPINTGVKIVNRKAICYEKEVWDLRNTYPWNQFPFEQKTIYEYILPKISGKYRIHNPYVLNCIIKAYPTMVEDALFVHMCGTPEPERNIIIQKYVNEKSIKFDENKKRNIGYFHICQKNGWKTSFDLIFKQIKEYGLYNNTDEIRCIIVNDSTNIIDDDRFNDSKIKVIYLDKSENYERPTLLHMRTHAHKDGECNYWYVHTKGLRWFETAKKDNVIDWIKLLLYWNIVKWNTAVLHLNENDIYGCNYTSIPQPHYSGNFWWATSAYIRTLPSVIDVKYNDPEFWLFSGETKPKYKNIFSSGLEGMGHYNTRFELKLHHLIDNTRTDKNTCHSYLDIYQQIFENLNFKKMNILEIGIGPADTLNGGSVKLWNDYFINSKIFAIDIIDTKDVWNNIKNNDNIILYTSADGYDELFVKNEFTEKGIKFDIIIDDGPHTLESMINCIKLYTSLLTEKGILIIEDVQSIIWIEVMKKYVPSELLKYVKVYDLRHIKNRWDDIIFAIIKE